MGVIEDELRVLFAQSIHNRFSFLSAPEETWHPLTDVYETGREIIVKMELPGVDMKDLQVMLEDRRLIVQGVRKDPSVNEKVSYQRMEISYGPFRRIVLLPATVKIRGAKARYREGFLEVQLPFADEHSTEPMEVPIE